MLTTPETRLDTPYSDPTAQPAEWAETRKLLETAELFWICTVRADGRPHVTPVVAVWSGDAVVFSTGEGEQKHVNLQHNPHVVLITGCNRWDSGTDVVVEGDAVRITDDATLQRAATAFTARWDGRWQYTVGGGRFQVPSGNAGPEVFAVTPVKVFAHAKGDPFGATRHRFG